MVKRECDICFLFPVEFLHETKEFSLSYQTSKVWKIEVYNNTHLYEFWTNSFSWAYQKATFQERCWKLSEVWWVNTARNRFQRMARGESTWKLAWHISHRRLPKCCPRLVVERNNISDYFCTVQGRIHQSITICDALMDMYVSTILVNICNTKIVKAFCIQPMNKGIGNALHYGLSSTFNLLTFWGRKSLLMPLGFIKFGKLF